VVERARIVLLAAEGVPGKQIAAMVGCAEPTVVTWQRRYAESGLAGLEDLPRPGKPAQLPEELRDRVLELTLSEPPIQFGATHWSSRLLATALAGEGTPTWVRSAPTPGSRASRRHQEFLAFLKQVAAAYPRRQLHVVVDNLSTHKHPVVGAWLERHPRVQLHFTPTSGSRLNLIEAFFSTLTRQALRQLSHRGRPHRRHPAVHRRLERPLPAVHLDQRPRHRHRQGHRPAPPQDTNDVSYGH
jgi:transposase